MSRRGDCYDNAVMESFFSTVKSELADRFDSVGEATRELFDYIEVFITSGAVIRRSAKSVRPPSNDVHRRHSGDRGRSVAAPIPTTCLTGTPPSARQLSSTMIKDT